MNLSEWRICIRAQRKANLCAPGAPKGPKVGMSVRQYEILCANDAGRAPRKYPASTRLVGGNFGSDQLLNNISYADDMRVGSLQLVCRNY